MSVHSVVDVDGDAFHQRPPSRRAGITRTVARASLRPVTSSLPANRAGLAVSRGILAGALAAFGWSARGSLVIPVDSTTHDRGRLRGEWVRRRGVGVEEPRTGHVILYVHGSGYAACSVATHRGLVAQIADQTGLDAFSVDYRLAPRHRFPAAIDDVERAFEWLVDQGVSADRIIVMGDSAGGHLAIDLALHRRRTGLPGPAALVVFSPLVDHTFRLSSRREQARPDPLVTAAAAKRLIDHYAGDIDPEHPRLTHVIAEGESLPPTLIQAGGAEMLAADAHALHRSLVRSQTPVRLEVWPGQLHVFQAMPRLIPEASVALRRATTFVRAVVASMPAAAEEERSA